MNSHISRLTRLALLLIALTAVAASVRTVSPHPPVSRPTSQAPKTANPANEGQTDGRVKLTSRASSYPLFLTPTDRADNTWEFSAYRAMLGGAPPTLGNYPNTSVQLSANTTVTPDATPATATRITVATSTNFKGKLEGDPTTGVVRVTDAHPAGTYMVTVTAFDGIGATMMKTFTLTVTTPLTCNPVSFAAAANFGVETNPRSVAVGDFNGDGMQDLATANQNSNSVSVLLGNGAGGFGGASNFGVGSKPFSMAVGDFNGDGRQDLVTANQNSNNVSVLLGNGAGGFGGVSNFGAGSSPISVVVGDFNGDGNQDLATANQNSNRVSVLLGNGAGGFSAAGSFVVGSQPFSMALGDFNGDGKQDLVTANESSNNVSVLLGNGSGGFSAGGSFGIAGFPFSVVVGDFNGDGRQDLAVANESSNNVSVLLGNGSGGFSAGGSFGAGGFPFSMAVGDFNGDGMQDLATANFGQGNVSILSGDGAGGFNLARSFGAGSGPISVAVGDFNGDGMQDLATANESSNNSSVLLRQCVPTTFPVTNTNDSGAGSLRQAILEANISPGTTDTIAFNIPGGGVKTITPASPLPTITAPIIIDGYTQPGASANTLATGNDAVVLIELDGTGAGMANGLRISAGGSTVRGLAINRFAGSFIDPTVGNGIALLTGGGNTVEGCFLGTDATGTISRANFNAGLFSNSPNNLIGGASPAARNLLSGNQLEGVELSGVGATGNRVEGNFIGTNANGAAALGNAFGVLTTDGSTNNTIGGVASAGQRNVISGNFSNGVFLGSGSNTVQGNYVGLSSAGAAALGNGASGVAAVGSSNNDIGGTVALARNIISSNQGHGVEITDSSATGNLVRGNFIGTNAAGSANLGNTGSGVLVDSGSGNTVGGTASGAGNRIAFNGQDGVSIGSGTGNTVLSNSIFSNGTTASHLGIDLDPDGLTPNDAGDGDMGANNLQNFPDLNFATLAGSTTTVSGMLNSAANTTFRVEFFSSAACDASGNGEGQTFLGSMNVMTDAGGNAPVNAAFAGLSAGQFITATATDPSGNTSEFSSCVTVMQAPPGTVQFSQATYNAGENAGTVTLTVTRIDGTNGAVTVAYTDTPGTATTPADYSNAAGTVTFADGDSAPKTFTININNDTLDETDESFTVALNVTSGLAMVGSQGTATVTITDDDAPPAVSVGDAVLAEGDSGTQAMTFTVTLSAQSGQAVGVNFSTADGTATAGTDYDAASGTVNIPAGSTSATFNVAVRGDTVDEPDETFLVNLTNPTNATLNDGQGTGTITDDDPTPSLSVGDLSVSEGNSGTTAAVFSVTLSAPSGRAVSVDYATSNGTATAGLDYQPTSGTLNFAAGESSKQVTVQVNGDTTNEPNETFFLDLSNAVNASVADPRGAATINDDDSTPALSISDATTAEGNNGTTVATFDVTLSAPSGQTVTVGFSTADGTANAGTDYQPTTGTLTFNPGETTKPVTVQVNGDLLDESDETFLVNLDTPTNATLGDAQGVGTILDNDGAPSLSVGDVTVTEGNSGTTAAVFNVTLSAASSQTVTASFATADGTATAGSDYDAISGTVNIPAGSTSATFSVAVRGDTVDEPNETFSVNLSAPSNATLGDGQGTGTIMDDDAPPSVSVGDASVTEGDGGTQAMMFTVTLSAVSGRDVSVNYATADQTATAGTDYDAAAGTVAIPAGSTSATFNVAVRGDLLDELDETFLVNLSAPSNATLGDGQGTGTILDNDAAPTFAIGDVSVVEGDGGTTPATFNVTLSAASGRVVTIDYATADATASAPADYQPATGTLTFNPGETTKPVTVQVNGDLLDESDETFLVNLSDAINATAADAQATGTITDDDAPPSVSVGDATLAEGDSGTQAMTFTVSLSAASGKAVSVNISTADGTATAGSDYDAAVVIVNIPAGSTSATFTVAVRGDTVDEPNEAFFVNLSSPLNATIGDGQGTGTIMDDDGAPALSVGDVAVTEGNSGTTAAVFNVMLLPASGQAVSVNFSTADGTATAGTDYQPASGTLNFQPGETGKTIIVAVNGDTQFEPAESFFVNLSAPTNATISDGQGQGTITNDDAPAANLSLTKTDSPDPVVAGQNLTYTITVTNNGPDTANGVTVTDALPAGVTFVSSTPSQGSCAGTATVTCALGTLANGAAASVQIVVQPLAAGMLSNTAGVIANEGDPDTSNNQATQATFVNPPPIQTFTISGRVKDTNGGGIVGVNLSLSGSRTAAATSDGGGNYSFNGLPAGDYTVTPSEVNFVFTPASLTFSDLNTDQTGADFTGTLVNFQLAGRVTDTGGNGIPDVTVTLSGALSKVVQTDAAGNYAFTVPARSNLTVTVEKLGIIFNPARRDFVNLSANQQADFTGAPQPNPPPPPDPNDDFNGPVRDPERWSSGLVTQPPSNYDPLVEVRQQNGQLRITPRPAANGPSYNGYVSARAIDLNVTPTVSIEITQTATGPGVQTIFGLGKDSDNFFRFVVEDTSSIQPFAPKAAGATAGAAMPDPQTLSFQSIFDGSKFSSSIPYDPQQHRFWRFRYDVGELQIVYETSPDAVVWTERFRADIGGGVTNLIVEISAGTTRPSPNPTVAVFDNYLVSRPPPAATFTISGRVTDTNGAGLAGVAVTLSDSRMRKTTATNVDGNYDFTNLPAGGTYTVAASKLGFVFTPPSRTFNGLAGNQTLNFTGARLTSDFFNIGGRVTDVNGNGVGNVSVALSGAQSRTTRTDAGGNYVFNNVAAGASYAVTASRFGFTISPPRQNIAALVSDVTLNFTAAAQPSPTPPPPPGDDFNEDRGDNNPDPNKFSLGVLTRPPAAFDPRVIITQAGGVLRITPVSGASGESFNSYVSVRPTDLNVTPTAQIQVPKAATGEGTQTVFSLGADIDNFNSFVVQDACEPLPCSNIPGAKGGGQARAGAVPEQVLVFQTSIAGTRSAASIAYNSEQHRYWRFRYDANERQIVYETSPNAVVWTEQRRAGVGGGVTNLIVEISAGTTSPSPNPTAAVFDDLAIPPAVDSPEFFVRQQYLDFLNREPDRLGYRFWLNKILECGGLQDVDVAQCIEVRRINVSAAFFLSIEFQETGFLVYRTHKAAFGNLPGKPVPVRLEVFKPDARRIGAGVVVGTDGWQNILAKNKRDFAEEFVNRPAFKQAYDQLGAEQYVDKLFANAGVQPSGDERTTLIISLVTGELTRGDVLLHVAEKPEFRAKEYNAAFVLLQYFGYLNRNPDDIGFDGQPDPNFLGYNFWLGQLNRFNGDYQRAEMVKAFISSIEYRERLSRPVPNP